MCLPRIRARVSSAAYLTTAYATHRRLAFHKRGKDGSAKADVQYTGRAEERVWGVVLSVHAAEKPILDDFEGGYDTEEIVVVGRERKLAAITYVARPETIEPALKPFSWYHNFVVQGAKEHRLPADYIHFLESIESVSDPDIDRHHRNLQLIGHPRKPLER